MKQTVVTTGDHEVNIEAAHKRSIAGRRISDSALEFYITQIIRNGQPEPGTDRWCLLHAYRREQQRRQQR